MTEKQFNNLELYFGPADGEIMPLPTIDVLDGTGRPTVVFIQGGHYNIYRAEECRNLNPSLGVTHIGVYDEFGE